MCILLCQFLVFAQLLRLGATTVPSLNVGSLPQPAVAGIPSLESSSTFTLPPFPAATTLRNTSNDILPPNYLIPDTDPLVILQINPTRHYPVDLPTLTYMIVHGLDSLVGDTIKYHGDQPIPSRGMTLSSNTVGISAQSHLPGMAGLTCGTMASLLRGIWEITALFGSCELDMEVYIGSQDPAHYRGHLSVYLTQGASETA